MCGNLWLSNDWFYMSNICRCFYLSFLELRFYTLIIVYLGLTWYIWIEKSIFTKNKVSIYFLQFDCLLSRLCCLQLNYSLNFAKTIFTFNAGIGNKMKTMTFSVNLLRVKLLLGVFLRKILTFEYLTEVLTQPHLPVQSLQ